MVNNFFNNPESYSNNALQQQQACDKNIDFIEQYLSPKSALKVLDLGCGSGYFCQQYKNKIDYIGVDQSLNMINYCKHKYKSTDGSTYNFYCNTIEEWSTNAKFDVIHSNFTWQWLQGQDFYGHIDRYYSMLKTGGMMIFAIPVRQTFKSFFEASKQHGINVQNFAEFRKVSLIKDYLSKFNAAIYTYKINIGDMSARNFLRYCQSIGASSRHEKVAHKDIRKILQIKDNLNLFYNVAVIIITKK